MRMSELDKLEAYLKEHGYEYERITEENMNTDLWSREVVDMGRKQIVVSENGKRKWDAICQWGSYGYNEGLLEIYGSIVDEKKDGDDVVGWLTAQDVIDRLEGK